MTPEFWILAVFGLVFYAVLFYVDRRWGRKLLNKDFSERERTMAASLMKSEQAYVRMETTIDLLSRQLTDRDMQLAEMRQGSAERDEKIRELTGEVRTLRATLESERKEFDELKRKLEDRNVIEKPPMHILGIWPLVLAQAVLDQQSEADAMYNAGYAYTALRGTRANRAGVILEIDRVRPTIIQVGGHGDSSGIMLSDGTAEPGWWGEVVAGKNIQLMVLLSCDSSQQDELNISDALIRAGVRAVISCDSAIGDKDAVRFAELLYSKLAEGLPLAKAMQRAKLAVSRKAAEMIRLREGR